MVVVEEWELDLAVFGQVFFRVNPDGAMEHVSFRDMQIEGMADWNEVSRRIDKDFIDALVGGDNQGVTEARVYKVRQKDE